MANETPKTPKTPPKSDPEQLRKKKEERARRARRRNRQLIGLALAILIVVGAVSIITSGYNVVKGLMEGSDESDEYKAMLEPFVWFDTLPFDSLEHASEDSLKQVVIWGIMTRRPETLERNDFGEPMIAAAAVDQYAMEMFGPEFRFSQHGPFSDPEQQLNYGFNADTMMYTAPSTGLTPPYIATVVEVVRESGGVRRVVMGYVNTMVDDQFVAAPDMDHPAKYMDFLLRRDGSSYYLYALVSNTSHVPSAASQPAPESTAQSEETPPASSSSRPASSSSSRSGSEADDGAAENEPIGDDN